MPKGPRGRIVFINARVFKPGAVIIFKPGFGWLHVQKLYGKAFLCRKYTRLPGTSRKLHGRMYLAQSRGTEKKLKKGHKNDDLKKKSMLIF
jgi:hypothetical protein